MSSPDTPSEATTSAVETSSTIGVPDSEIEATSSAIPIDSTELQITVPQVVDLLPSQAQPFWEVIQRIPFLESLIIVIVFLALAHLIRKYAIKLIENIAGRTESDVDDLIVNKLRGPIFSTVAWIGILVAVASAGLSDSWSNSLNRLILSAIVIIWLRAFFSLSSLVFTEMSRDTKRFKKIDIRTEPLLIIVSKLVILLVVSYILLLIWGINPLGLFASAGIAGIAVGFAAKDTLANLFSGVFILADRPYKLGDYINLDTGERGKVTHIGIRSTRILTRDDIEVTIPNAVIGNTMVVNESGGPYQKIRIRLDTQCAYESNLDDVCALLQTMLEEQRDLCKYPAPRVRVRGLGDSGINIQLLGWIEKPEDRGLITHTLYMQVHRKMREAGVEIPYPKRDIHIIS